MVFISVAVTLLPSTCYGAGPSLASLYQAVRKTSLMKSHCYVTCPSFPPISSPPSVMLLPRFALQNIIEPFSSRPYMRSDSTKAHVVKQLDCHMCHKLPQKTPVESYRVTMVNTCLKCPSVTRPKTQYSTS